LFCKKEEESGFSSISASLPKMVRSVPNSVRLLPRQRSTRLSYQGVKTRIQHEYTVIAAPATTTAAASRS
jgi:hypothetical protein